MSEPFLGELRIVSFGFAPRNWAMCNGQLLPINQNQALFALLGTTYGGNGQTTFALPNLQGRTPIHEGNSFTLGQAGGEVSHTLSMAEMPQHNHIPQGSSSASNSSTPGGNLWGSGGLATYSPSPPNASLPAGAISNTGGGQPHSNTPPYLVLNVIICLLGIFPSRN